MKNTTSVKVPVKLQGMITEVYKDSDGYWAASEAGYMFKDMGCHTAHEDTQKDLLRVIRSLVPCDCAGCLETLAKEAAAAAPVVVEENEPAEVPAEAPAVVEGNEVIEQFFAKWQAEWMAWFEEMQKAYRADYDHFMKEYRPQMSKQNMNMIRGCQLYPREHCGLSIQELVERDMKDKKAKLYSKIKGKVGTILEVDLYCGEDGTPNGTVKGTDGMVHITTIVAGGYIQCVHYRVLVK